MVINRLASPAAAQTPVHNPRQSVVVLAPAADKAKATRECNPESPLVSPTTGPRSVLREPLRTAKSKGGPEDEYEIA